MNLLKTLLIVFLLFSIQIFAQTDGEKLLSDLQKKFNSINDFTASINQTSGGGKGINGIIYFKKENKLRIESGNSTIVSDGLSYWNHDKKNKKLIITSKDESSSSLFSIDYIVYKFPNECSLSAASDGKFNKLILIPKKTNSEASKVTLWINSEYIIEKVETISPVSGKMEITFSNIKLNQNLADSKFTFTAPEGTKVIDLR